MIYTEALEYTTKSGRTFDVEFKVHQHEDDMNDVQHNIDPIIVRNVVDVSIMNEFAEDVTDELDHDTLEEILDYLNWKMEDEEN